MIQTKCGDGGCSKHKTCGRYSATKTEDYLPSLYPYDLQLGQPCPLFEPLKKYYRIESISNGGFYIEMEKNLSSILDMLKDCEPGDGYIISIVLMTEKEFFNLPEFTGF